MPTIQDIQPVTTTPLKSEAQQKHEKRQLFLRCLLTPGEYELYGFNKANKDYAYMLNFLSIYDLRHIVLASLNDTNWKAILDNKWFFHLHYSSLGIPVPRTYGVYQPWGGVTVDGKPLGNQQQLRSFVNEVRPRSLVIKPVGGIMGKNVLILDEIYYDGSSIAAVSSTGQQLTFEDIVEKLDAPPNVRFFSATYKLDLPGYLLQEKLRQHEFLNSIAPFTTNSIRVVTFVDRNNKGHVQAAMVRLGRMGHAVDNWDKGGISVGLDIATGVFGRGVMKPKYGSNWVDAHPDSGVAFSGLQMPYWNEIVRTCLRAAEGTPNVRSVGWDVVLTPDGPVLIEGNPDWGIHSVQVHTDGLLRPEVRRQFEEFGLTFARDKLPPVDLRRLWVWFAERERQSQHSRETLSDRFTRFVSRLRGR